MAYLPCLLFSRKDYKNAPTYCNCERGASCDHVTEKGTRAGLCNQLFGLVGAMLYTEGTVRAHNWMPFAQIWTMGERLRQRRFLIWKPRVGTSRSNPAIHADWVGARFYLEMYTVWHPDRFNGVDSSSSTLVCVGGRDDQG